MIKIFTKPILRKLRLVPLVLPAIFVGVIVSCVQDEGGEIPLFLDVLAETNTISFDSSIIREEHMESYQVAVSQFTSNLQVTLEDEAGVFQISTSSTSGFGNSLDIAAAGITDDRVTIFIKFFTETAAESYTATITHTTEGLVNDAVVQIDGLGILDPGKTPNVATNVPVIAFDPTVIGATQVISYELTASKLQGAVDLELSDATAPFGISKEMTGPFTSTLNYAVDEFSPGPVTIYVQFAPVAEGQFNADVELTTVDLPIVPKVALSGQGTLDPPKLLFSEDFVYTESILPHTDRVPTNAGDDNAMVEGWIAVRSGRTPFQLTNGLSFPGYTGIGLGQGILVEFDASAGPTNRQLFAHNIAEQQDATFTGEYFMSYLLEMNAIPAKGQFNRPVFFVDWAATGVTDFSVGAVIKNTAAAGDPADNVVFSLRDNNTEQISSIPVQTGQAYLVVLKLTVTDDDQSNNNNEAELFIFDAAAPASEPVTADITMTGIIDSRLFRAVAILKDNSGAASYVVDGIKVANTWEDLFK